MWSTTVICCIIYIFVLEVENENVQAKTYYFNVNKTSNEFTIYNRINLNNPTNYPSALYASELKNNRSPRKNLTNVEITYPLLDEEWNYNWKNLTRKELPSYIHKLYDSVTKKYDGTYRILFNSLPQNSTIIQFNLSSLNTKENYSDIELHFYHNVDRDLLQKPIILRLYKIEQENFNKSQLINPEAHKLLNVIYILQADSGWQMFKLRNAIENWPTEDNKLSLMITISRPNEQQFGLFNDTNRDIFRTFIVLKSPSAYNIRNINETLDGPCQKRDLFFDFSKLNWRKFIIAPEGFNAYTCIGKCYRIVNESNYLKMVSSLPEHHKRSFCCVPIDYLPLPIMFYDKSGNVIIKIYDKMIVSECGCR